VFPFLLYIATPDDTPPRGSEWGCGATRVTRATNEGLKGCRKIRGISASPDLDDAAYFRVTRGCTEERTSCNNAFVSFQCRGDSDHSDRLASTAPPGQPGGAHDDPYSPVRPIQESKALEHLDISSEGTLVAVVPPRDEQFPPLLQVSNT
jgi:hypothetical protein